MLPYLSENCPFPEVGVALSEPNGLLAAGGDLSSERLIQAYSHGIFPWYSPGEPILWWSPDPRTVFFIEQFKVHKSVPKTLRNQSLRISLNESFEKVLTECARPRGKENGTWITQEMIAAYTKLHHEGHAHSLEVWQEEQLVGGIYGVASGRVFCGESMFSRISNASKIALSCLARLLMQHRFQLIDCQMENPHLMKLGASNISRQQYLEILGQQNLASKLANVESAGYDEQNIWNARTLDWKILLGIKANV